MGRGQNQGKGRFTDDWRERERWGKEEMFSGERWRRKEESERERGEREEEGTRFRRGRKIFSLRDAERKHGEDGQVY